VGWYAVDVQVECSVVVMYKREKNNAKTKRTETTSAKFQGVEPRAPASPPMFPTQTTHDALSIDHSPSLNRSLTFTHSLTHPHSFTHSLPRCAHSLEYFLYLVYLTSPTSNTPYLPSLSTLLVPSRHITTPHTPASSRPTISPISRPPIPHLSSRILAIPITHRTRS
jgi:hypothetical protein